MIVIIHRFTGAHNDNVRYALADVRLDAVDLVKHLGGFEATHQTIESRCAETATHTAADLGRDADGIAVFIAHEDRLHHIAIRQGEEIFSRTIDPGDLQILLGKNHKRRLLLQLLS